MRFPLFMLASSVSKSLQCLISTLTQGGEGGHLFKLTCSVVLWGGRNTANKYHWRVWGGLTVSGPHWVCSSSWHMCFSWSTLLRLQVALQGNYLKLALGCVHFPGLSHSSSGTHKGTDSVGPAFCALPRSEQLRQPGAWRVHSPQVGNASYHLPCPSRSVSWMHRGSAISGALCVSSWELISGCSPPGRFQLSRIPGRLG